MLCKSVLPPLWVKRASRHASRQLLVSGGWWPFKSRMGVQEGSWLVTSCGVWLLAPWHKTLQRLLHACQPFQFALSTRAGTEADARALLGATEARPDATILSVDGVGAFDHISRQAMLQGLCTGANACVPFVRQFYAAPSRFVQAHEIFQPEGGEQGDPLMPAVFALGQHAALAEVQRHLRPDELLLAYLDDVFFITSPGQVFDLLSLHLHPHAHIWLHRGNELVGNARCRLVVLGVEVGGRWSRPRRGLPCCDLLCAAPMCTDGRVCFRQLFAPPLPRA